MAMSVNLQQGLEEIREVLGSNMSIVFGIDFRTNFNLYTGDIDFTEENSILSDI